MPSKFARTSLTLAVLCALCMASDARAQPAIQAPEYRSGPNVVSGGLLWSGLSAGHDNVLLSTDTGTRLLVEDANLSTVVVNDGWVLVAKPSGPEVGRVGGPLRAPPGLRHCLPIQVNARASDESSDTVILSSPERGRATVGDGPEDRLDAIANGELYAVVRASCLDRGPKHAQLLVRMRLGTGDLEVIGRVPSGAISLAAAGARVALTYETGAGSRVRVDVLDAHNAQLLFSLAPPDASGGFHYDHTQIDSKGDVLVTSTLITLPAYNAFGWWGNASARVGQPLPAGEKVTPSLYEGQIAYVPSREGEVESVKLLDLATQQTQTIVTFSGTARIEGLGLGVTGLAWAQQTYEYTLVESQWGASTCDFLTRAGPAELLTAPISQSGPPITVSHTSTPTAPGCFVG